MKVQCQENATHLLPNPIHSSYLCENNTPLSYSDRVVHLGHILTYDLDDRPDIVRVVKEMNCKANSILCTFKWADPFIKCFLVKSYCMSLYGSVLWSISSPSLKIIEVSLNKLIRKIWSLPYNSHTGIVHCVAQLPTISNILYKRSLSLFSRAMPSSHLVQSIFVRAMKMIYTSTGYNLTHGHEHMRFYSYTEQYAATVIRQFRHLFGLSSPCEDIIFSLSCN